MTPEERAIIELMDELDRAGTLADVYNMGRMDGPLDAAVWLARACNFDDSSGRVLLNALAKLSSGALKDVYNLCPDSDLESIEGWAPLDEAVYAWRADLQGGTP